MGIWRTSSKGHRSVMTLVMVLEPTQHVLVDSPFHPELEKRIIGSREPNGRDAMRCLWSQVRAAGDGALLLEFGRRMDPKMTRAIHATAQAIRSAGIDGVWGVVPAYTTLLVEFDPRRTTGRDVLDNVSGIDVVVDEGNPRCFVIPTTYGGDYGRDLEEVAKILGVSPSVVVAAHTARPYQIYCVGFSPGFPLCGELPITLRVSRRASPRTLVPAGSVAIAGSQTGVYPTASPGGWNLLGQTPLGLFQLDRDPPIVYQPGDFLQFRAIEPVKFQEMAEQARQGVTVIEEVPYALN